MSIFAFNIGGRLPRLFPAVALLFYLPFLFVKHINSIYPVFQTDTGAKLFQPLFSVGRLPVQGLF